MSNVNFHQYFSAELKEFHAILVYQQESYSRKLKENGSKAEFDETETLVKLKETIDMASEFFRGFSDLLAEGKMEKIKMNIQAILSYINSSNNTYLKDYTKLFDEALERLAELSMIVEPTIQNTDGEIVFEKNTPIPYEEEVAYAVNNLSKLSYIIVGCGFTIALVVNLIAIHLMGDGFISSALVLLLNIIYVFCILFGFKYFSTKLLKIKLAEESNEGLVSNIGKLISDTECTQVVKLAYKENDHQRGTFDKVVFNTNRQSIKPQERTPSTKVGNTGYKYYGYNDSSNNSLSGSYEDPS